MKFFFLLLLPFLALEVSKDDDKIIMAYADVIAKSDLIVEGVIDGLEKTSYEFSVSDNIKGRSDKKISVKKWRQWVCDSRMAKYEEGQKLILFLTKDKNGEYRIINGSTGELIITEDDAVLRYDYQSLPKSKIIKLGIRKFLQCFTYEEVKKFPYRHLFIPVVDQSQVEDNKRNNRFFKRIVKYMSFKKDS